jgi:hypothetical protein
MKVTNKLSYLFLLILTVGLYACGDDDNTVVTPTTVDPVTNLRVTASTQDSIVVEWDYTAAADSFRILRSPVGAGAAASATVPGSVRRFADRGFTGTAFSYTVTVIRGTQRSADRFLTTTVGLRQVVLAGSITTNTTLNSDTTYILQGFVQVQPGVTLTIPAGTLILGDFETKGALITVRGSGTRASGRIVANGTQARPIIFTSERPAGSRMRGDWGGIVLNGLSLNNGAIDASGIRTLVGEGNTGAHGGSNANDTSGVLRYVRVEFGGTRITQDNEINGFTFNSVGAGTVLEYLQAHFIADDGFEWFGGTVNSRYLLSTGCDDDNFDTDNSFIGKGQFWAAIQDQRLGNRGYESDNDATGSSIRANNGRLTGPQVYNVTLVGAGVAQANDDRNDGMYVRRNAQGLYFNHIVVNFGGFGLVIDGTASRANFNNDSLYVRNSILFTRGLFNLLGTGPNAGQTVWGAFRAANYDTVGFYARANTWSNRNVDPQLTGVTAAVLAATNPANPLTGSPVDLRPAAGSPALTGAATPPNDGFFDVTATFVGAFNAANNWTSGWTQWALN